MGSLMTTLKNTLTAVCTATLLLQAPSLLAQDASPAPSATAAPSVAATPANPAQMAPGSPADFRQRMNDRLKGALKASDDEWAVIQPLLEKVQTAQRATMTVRFGGFGGMRRRGGPGGDTGAASPAVTGTAGGANPAGDGGRRFGPQSSPEAEALHTALQSDSTSNEDIQSKLQALRDARKKAQGDLEQARENLKKVLTLKQEATFVEMGILE